MNQTDQEPKKPTEGEIRSSQIQAVILTVLTLVISAAVLRLIGW